MKSIGALDFDEYVASRTQERPKEDGRRARGHEYTYSLDQKTRATFEKIKAVELAITSIVRMSKQVQVHQAG